MAKASAFSRLQEKLKHLDQPVASRVVGTVQSYSDGVATIAGLDDIMLGELVDLGHNVLGLAMNLNEESVGVVVLGDAGHLSVGAPVYGTGRLLSIGVSNEIVGRVVDPLGNVLDEKGDITPEKYELLEKIAPGVMARQSVSQPLQTGVKAVDAMIPIGRGQRELLIGDRGTGKSAVALGTILNQHDQDVICVYVAIGQKRSFLSQTITTLEHHGAMKYTVVVSASASDSASLQFLAPMAGTAIAEFFLAQGKDVLIVYDDLSKHAQAYREVSLLLRRPSGREAYPGDIFYLHSRLLERACRLNPEHGGGSITALPIIETQAGDISAYVPTNVISITDGQIYFEADLFNAGVRPAINVGASVSRVGSSAQIKAMKQVAGPMKLELAQFRELEAFAQFSSDLDPTTKKQLNRGQRLSRVLNQGWDTPLPVEEEIAVIFAATRGFLDELQLEVLGEWETQFRQYLRDMEAEMLTAIRTEQKLSPEIEAQLSSAVQTFNDLHSEWKVAVEE